MRLARARAGYTLDQLAERAGLSKAYLSRLESAERQPSVATLLTLSRVLGVPMSVLLGEGGGRGQLTIFDGRGPAHLANGLGISVCSGFAGSRALEAVRLHIEADRTPPPFASHGGEEWVYVLSGVLRFEYDGATHLLEAGQSAHFDANRPHRLGAPADVTEVLLVAADSPTSFGGCVNNQTVTASLRS